MISFDSYRQFRPLLAVVEIKQAALSYREDLATSGGAYLDLDGG